MKRLTPGDVDARVAKWRSLGMAPQWGTEEIKKTAHDAQAFHDRLVEVSRQLMELGASFSVSRDCAVIQSSIDALLRERP